MLPEKLMSRTPYRAVRRGVFTALLVAILPQPASHAQSTDQMTMTLPSDWLTVAKKGPLLTYDDGKIRKDGYRIASTKSGDPNFWWCDGFKDSVDVTKLTNAKATDCGNDDWQHHGPIAAYIDAIGANGDVHLVTPHGDQIIAKRKWDELVESASKTFGADKKTNIKVGDFAAFTKDERGNYATMLMLAPSETRGGT
jgi:hypothetical protein